MYMSRDTTKTIMTLSKVSCWVKKPKNKGFVSAAQAGGAGWYHEMNTWNNHALSWATPAQKTSPIVPAASCLLKAWTTRPKRWCLSGHTRYFISAWIYDKIYCYHINIFEGNSLSINILLIVYHKNLIYVTFGILFLSFSSNILLHPRKVSNRCSSS